MPADSPSRTIRCVNCRSTEFVQQQIVTVRTPVDVTRSGQGISATANNQPQAVINQRSIEIQCANCSKPLTGVKPAHDVTFRLQQSTAREKALLDMHFYLWPEKYPLEQRREHAAWHEDMTEFEWSSDTIEDVAAILLDGLLTHPDVPPVDQRNATARAKAIAAAKKELGL